MTSHQIYKQHLMACHFRECLVWISTAGGTFQSKKSSRASSPRVASYTCPHSQMHQEFALDSPLWLGLDRLGNSQFIACHGSPISSCHLWTITRCGGSMVEAIAITYCGCSCRCFCSWRSCCSHHCPRCAGSSIVVLVLLVIAILVPVAIA